MPSIRLREGLYPDARALSLGNLGQTIWVQIPGYTATLQAIAATEINRTTGLMVSVDSAGAARVFNEIPQRTVVSRTGRFFQTRPLPIAEQETLYGVVYAVVTARGILVGGDRLTPALIEVPSPVERIQVQNPNLVTIVSWGSDTTSLTDGHLYQWIEGIQSDEPRSLDALLGGGWIQSREMTVTGSTVSVFSGLYYLSSPDGSETTGELSGTDASLAGGSTDLLAQVPIIAGITRSCSVSQFDTFTTITGTYDAQQPLMMRGDGQQSLVVHRYGSISESERLQTSRLFLADPSGGEISVNSAPGIAIELDPVTVTPGAIALEPGFDFDNYLDSSPRPVIAALSGMTIVLVSRVDGVITKGFGVITGYITSSIPGSFGGKTRLEVVNVMIDRVLEVPFDGALSTAGLGNVAMLYSNIGSAIDFLLQSQVYRYVSIGGNATGLSTTGDLSEKVPLGNFNLIGNSLIDGSAFVQWIADKIYVSENLTQNLSDAADSYADEWRLIPSDDGLLFVKQDEPLTASRSAITEPDEIYSLLSSAFYER